MDAVVEAGTRDLDSERGSLSDGSPVEKGEIWRTYDRGATWDRYADSSVDNVGRLRTLDMAKMGGFYAIKGDEWEYCELVAQADDGVWHDVPLGGGLGCHARIVTLGDALLVVGVGDSRTLYRVTSPWTWEVIRLPTAHATRQLGVIESLYHGRVVVGDELYVIVEGGEVLRSRDLRDWRSVTYVPDAMTIEYWPARDALVIASSGGALHVLTLESS